MVATDDKHSPQGESPTFDLLAYLAQRQVLVEAMLWSVPSPSPILKRYMRPCAIP